MLRVQNFTTFEACYRNLVAIDVERVVTFGNEVAPAFREGIM
jgi:hypothetical protein